MKEYKTDFDCEQRTYETGAVRSDSEGKGRPDLIPSVCLFRLAKHYERGAVEHGDRNWEKGFKISRAISSAIRHLYQYKDKLEDEDHAMAAVWNIFAAVFFEEMIDEELMSPELDDRPVYKKKDFLDEPKDVEIENKPLSITDDLVLDSNGRVKTIGRKKLRKCDIWNSIGPKRFK